MISSKLNSDEQTRYDAVVIGGGVGGYVAAIRLGQLGKNVALIEKDKIGGVCLNVGCIPSKALISASKFVKNARNASKMGIDANVTVDLNKLQAWKRSVVERLTSGVSQLCRSNNVKIIRGEARLLSKDQLEIQGDSGKSKIATNDLIIATGSSPIELPNIKFDGKRVISSTEALALDKIPKRLLIIGAGAVGLEIGMAYANLFGTELIIVELLDQILPGVDPELSNVVMRSLQRLHAKIYLKSRVESAKISGDFVTVTVKDPEGKELNIETEYVLVSVGRRPNTKGLNLEGIGVDLKKGGFINVDNKMRTSVSNVYAIGDVVGGPLLAHKASREGIVAAEVISGMSSSFDNIAIPSSIFTDPEIATAGLSAKEANERGIKTAIGKFPFIANGRALASLESEGFTKIIADLDSGQVLGVEIVGHESSDLISEGTLAIEMGATLEDIALTIHPHPTLPETLMEAAENALGKAIHIQNRPIK